MRWVCLLLHSLNPAYRRQTEKEQKWQVLAMPLTPVHVQMLACEVKVWQRDL